MNPRNHAAALLALALLVPIPTFAGALPESANGQKLPSLAPMLEKVTPAVVNVAARTYEPGGESPLMQDPFFRFFFNTPGNQPPREGQSLGSGVIVNAAKGLILTNVHVIKDAREILVTLHDGRRLHAKVVGADPESDVAVIRVKAKHLTAIPMANSDHLRVGDFVVAIGNPFGLGQTVTSGIVSALGRSGLGLEGYEDFIQTDASINPGNSGGALVDLRGRLVGINTAILAPGGGNIGIGFAIPVNMAREIMHQLLTYGEVRRGLLGVVAQDLTPDLAQAFGIPDTVTGAVVVQVSEGSPGAKAGLQPGDIITAINGKPVTRAADVRNAVGLAMVGQSIQMRVLRNGRYFDVRAKVAESKQVQMDAQALNKRLAGATLGDIPPDTPLHGRIEGVLVTHVVQGSPAWFSGLRQGDVITSADRVRVKNLGELKKVVAHGGPALMLGIQRGSLSVFLLVR